MNKHAVVQIDGSGTRIQTELVRLLLWILHNNRPAVNLRLLISYKNGLVY